MNYSKYENKIPYPDTPAKPFLPKDKRNDVEALVAHTKAVKDYEAAMPEYRRLRDIYQTENGRLYAIFKVDALEEAGLTGHPKADKAFSLAYEDGHHAGYSEIMNYLYKYAELILD